ncbi:MAG TPA: OmpH family outer membrane protein [Candidatus Avirikenella pullistercoris]|nr:OmpH family outer membrane protein [Candidatus Avirikenella pullistercoris]
MNKKSLRVLFVVMTVALFAACGNNAKEGNGNTAAVATDKTANSPVAANIVYVNNDTLINGYLLFKELEGKYREKAEKVQSELESRTRSLERKAADYQEKVTKGLVTRAQALEIEQGLQTDQQSLLQYRDQVMTDLAEEEQVMFNNIWHNIIEYLNKYNEEKGYDMILNNNGATNTILVGNPALDITKEVMEGLNKEYTANQKSK